MSKAKFLNENFQQTRWAENIIYEHSVDGDRGILPPKTEPEILSEIDENWDIPSALKRKSKLNLPEVAQLYVLRHYTRLSQMVFGNNVANNIGLATATMKYSPLVNENLVRMKQVADIHPEQDTRTLQGIFEIIYNLEQALKGISGLDHFCMQPGGGAAAIFTNAKIVKQYHEDRGEGDQRTQIITTLNSHPANAAAAASAGFEVIHLPPGPAGYPDIEALKTAISDETAGLMTTNPEDTGLFNPEIEEWTNLIHKAGGLCVHDQANANGVIGIARSREAGFDLCHFNLHKTFSIPHGSYGGGAGAVGVRDDLERYLPKPRITFDGEKFNLDFDLPDSIGTVRSYLGNVQAQVKAFAWIMALGEKGIRKVAEIAVLNNNYMTKKIAEIRGASISFYPDNTDWRIEQTRFSWKELNRETGVDTEDIRNRVVDFGIQTYWPSHHPYTVAQPFSLEPTESVSKADIDELIEVFTRVSEESYENPEIVQSAPHKSSTAAVNPNSFADPPMSWRVYQRRRVT